jgi:hypothetical protein
MEGRFDESVNENFGDEELEEYRHSESRRRGG